MNTLFVVWQDPKERSWHPIGQLTRLGSEYQFAYTCGARVSPKFTPFADMPDLRAVYRSRDLFPTFANRVLGRSRPEYSQYVEWLGLGVLEPEPLDELARTGGIGADTLGLFAKPEKTADGLFRSHFFVHGIRYLPKEVGTALRMVRAGNRLFPMPDVQNEYDRNAVALRTDSPVIQVGYVPRFLAPDVLSLLTSNRDDLRVGVVQVNQAAPANMLILCMVECEWPTDFAPCAGPEFQTIVAGAAFLSA